MSSDLVSGTSCFCPGLCKKRAEIAEYDSGGNTASRSGHSAGERAEKSLFLYALTRSLGESVSESGKRHACPRASEVGYGLVNSYGAENNACRDKADEYSARGEICPVNEDLPYRAKRAANGKDLEILQKYLHIPSNQPFQLYSIIVFDDFPK